MKREMARGGSTKMSISLTALTRCASVIPQLRTVSYSRSNLVPMTVGSSLFREKLAPSRAKCSTGWSCTWPMGTAFVRMEDLKGGIVNLHTIRPKLVQRANPKEIAYASGSVMLWMKGFLIFCCYLRAALKVDAVAEATLVEGGIMQHSVTVADSLGMHHIQRLRNTRR